jgi:hypothetical protein
LLRGEDAGYRDSSYGNGKVWLSFNYACISANQSFLRAILIALPASTSRDRIYLIVVNFFCYEALALTIVTRQTFIVVDSKSMNAHWVF